MLRTKISLKNFFIFNSLYGPKEGEEENKLLFFYPEIEKNEKLKDVGFIEALIKFTGTFSLESTSEKDVLTMRTKKTMKLFFEPEKDFIMVLTINVPFERNGDDHHKKYYVDDAHELVFKKILQRSYLNFRLFCDTFNQNLIGENQMERIESLKTKLNNFYTKYLLTMNLQNADILDAIQCLQYKAVPHTLFFRIVNFVNLLISIKNLKIEKCIFLYNQEIVFSSINPADLFIINEYMTESLFPKYFQLRNNQAFEIDRSVGKFVTENESESLRSAPKIHLYGEVEKNGKEQTHKTYRMVVYSIMDVSLVILVDDNGDDEVLCDEFCNEIRYSIGPQLNIISKEISDSFQHFQNTSKTSGNDSENFHHEKYIYFNHRNFRFHACFYENNENGKRNTQMSSSIMNLLCDLYAQESEEPIKSNDNELINSERETIIKTYNDFWIVRKFYNYRSLYLILHKNSTLIDIAEESQRLLSDIVKNVYFTNQQ